MVTRVSVANDSTFANGIRMPYLIHHAVSILPPSSHDPIQTLYNIWSHWHGGAVRGVEIVGHGRAGKKGIWKIPCVP